MFISSQKAMKNEARLKNRGLTFNLHGVQKMSCVSKGNVKEIMVCIANWKLFVVTKNIRPILLQKKRTKELNFSSK